MRDPASSFLLRVLLTLVATALVLGLAYGGTARGGELDHYVPALNNVRDFALPDKGREVHLRVLRGGPSPRPDRHAVGCVQVLSRTERSSEPG
jgi:hypothetical protein